MGETSQTLSSPKRTSWWKLVFNIALLIALVVIFARQINENWEGIVGYHWGDVRWELVGIAFLVLLLCSLIEILIWNRSLGWFTESLSFLQATPVFIWSNLARYIPGKVASLFVRVALANEVKRAPVPVLAASALELALRTASALLVFVASLPAWGRVARADKFTGSFFYAGLAIIVVVLIVSHPKIMLPVLNWGLKKIKQPPIERRLRYRDILGLLGAETLRWILFGLAFALLAWALNLPAQRAFLALIGVACAAWAAGFIGMAPGGLGIAEGVQLLVLSTSLHFPRDVTLILAAFSRMCSLGAEGLWSVVALPLRYHNTRPSSESAQVPMMEE